MRIHRTLLALCLIPATSACAAARSEGADGPLAGFERLIGGEWRVTLASGATGRHAWRWGPGRFSMSRVSHGSWAQENPWQGELLYWHPGHGEVRVLTLHEDVPGVGRGVGTGTMRFDGETSEALLGLDQPRGTRRLGQRQVFDGRDAYREILLEDSGAGLQPLNALDFVRVEVRAESPEPVSDPAKRVFPGPWKPFEALVGGTWATDGQAFGAGARRVQTSFEWLPSLEVVLARVSASDGAGPATPWLEAFVYRPVSGDALRCLALSHRGAVYEGGVSALASGALQLDLLGYEGEGVQMLAVLLEIEPDGSLRQRVQSLEGAGPELLLEVRHRKLRSETNDPAVPASAQSSATRGHRRMSSAGGACRAV